MAASTSSEQSLRIASLISNSDSPIRQGRKRPWAPAALRADGAFEERLARLWFDNHLNADASRALLTSILGEDRLVFGTNFAGWDAPDDLGSHAPAPHLAANARRLLRLR